jgi:serine phosphatase RsbU (regulator of sigma subunit)
MKDKKVSCTLTVLSADLDTETVVISRNSNCPVIIKTPDYVSVYDENVNPIGVHHHTKPLMYEVPFEAGMVLVSYTDGIQHAGKKHSNPAEFQKIMDIINDNTAEDCEFIASSIMDYALSLDKNQAADDMTVVVMGLCETASDMPRVEKLTAVYPF